MNLTCDSTDGLIEIAEKLMGFLGNEPQVVVFEGDLGAGKTSFIKSLCNVLGCKDLVSSPTFSIVNEYRLGSEPVYHIDLYRLESLEEALNVGIEDYLHSGCWCFIEWPGIIKPILDFSHFECKISVLDDEERIFRILKHSTEP